MPGVVFDANLVYLDALCCGRPQTIPGGLRRDRYLSTASASVESDEDDRCLDLASGVHLFGTIFNIAVVATSRKA